MVQEQSLKYYFPYHWQYAKDKANNVLTLLGTTPPTVQLSPISAVMQHTKKRFEPDAK
ncbi:hypothetical protein Tcan_13530 [Toxocara canis]|uniref:Uncharacterized protein n=1 Tax=Toxocara canis TaxID=6265 RepID=A0A0B2VJC0_TOXCA|nr:hypothetical protein Tcan_13530 [Toxocara canis]